MNAALMSIKTFFKKNLINPKLLKAIVHFSIIYKKKKIEEELLLYFQHKQIQIFAIVQYAERGSSQQYL